jgi:hypothetical protein
MLGRNSTSTLLDGALLGRDVTGPLYVGRLAALSGSEPA